MVEAYWIKKETIIKCKECKKEVVSTNRMQKFCVECAAIRKKNRDRTYNQRKQQSQINKAFKDAGVML